MSLYRDTYLQQDFSMALHHYKYDTNKAIQYVLRENGKAWNMAFKEMIEELYPQYVPNLDKILLLL
jgi:hypothetical protein